MGRTTSRSFRGLIAGALCVLAAAAQAQPYPSRQVEVIVPYAPGGTTDFVTRVIGMKLSDMWHQPVVVLNKPGASGQLGADAAALAAGDGYTLLVTGYTNRNLLFSATPPVPNPAKDVIPIALVGKAPLLLLVNPDFPAKTLKDLIALAKAQPGKLNYASIGNGSPSHLGMEMLKRMAGIDIAHIPYKGSGPALIDLMAGHVPIMMDSVVSSSPHVKAGKLRALAVTTAARLPSLPEVPTVAESGLPGFDVFTWTALYVPAGTPTDRIEKIRADVARVLTQPDVVGRYASQGAIIPEPMTQAQTVAFLNADIAAWRKVISGREDFGGLGCDTFHGTDMPDSDPAEATRHATSPITNRWGAVAAVKLDVEHVSVCLGREGHGFNHQAQLAFDGDRLYATWSSAPRDEEEAGQRVVMAVSDDGGRSWSDPVTIAPARPGRYAPSVVVSSGMRIHDGALIAYTGEWERYEAERNKEREAQRAAAGGQSCFDVRTEARVSRDRGRTWSASTVVVRDQFGFMPPAPTRTGRLILPGHLTYAWTDDTTGLTGWRRAMLPGLPDDYLDIWYKRAEGARLLGLAHQFNEANFFETDDGVIHMMLRNENHTRMGVTESRDDGASWSTPMLTDYTNSVSRSHFGRLPDGRWFCVNCPTPPTAGAAPSTRTPRTPLVLAISKDGVVFDRHYVIGGEPQGEPRIAGYLKHGRYGYPFLVVIADQAAVVYSTNKEDINVARFRLPT